MSNLDSEMSFLEEEDGDRISIYEPYEDSAEELLEFLPAGCTPLSDIAYPNMNCHSFTLGLLNKINDPKNTWINYKAAMNLLSGEMDERFDANKFILDCQPKLIFFNRIYEKYNRSFPVHTGFLLPEYRILSAVEGVINLATIDSLANIYESIPIEEKGNIVIKTSILSPKTPINLQKLYLDFGISLE